MKTKKIFTTIILTLLSLNISSCGRTDMWDKLHESGLLSGYAVTYNGNGNESGSVPVDSTRYIENHPVRVLSNSGSLARSGYKFNGWALTAGSAATDYTAGQTFTMGSSDITLYARWIADSVITYNVSYNANGGSGDAPVDNTEYTDGQTVYLPARGTLANGSNPFCGWNVTQSSPLLSANHQPGETITIDSNITFYALWEPPIMINEDFSSDTIATDMFITEGPVTIPSGTGIVNISDNNDFPYGAIKSREFRIPAIIEGVATIYPSDNASQRRNSFIVARDEVYDSDNLPSSFSFDILNLVANADIYTIVHLYHSDGPESLIDNESGFPVYPVEGDIASIQPRRFRIVLYNTYQEFYIYDETAPGWVLVRSVTDYTLTSDVWWYFYMVSNETPSAYPHKLDSITIRAIGQSDENPVLP